MARGLAGVVIWLIAASTALAQPIGTIDGIDPAAPPAEAQAQAETLAIPSFGSLFRDLGSDVRRMGSLETVVILAGGGAGSPAARPHDRRLTEAASLACTDTPRRSARTRVSCAGWS